jgi:hypothetical protein
MQDEKEPTEEEWLSIAEFEEWKTFVHMRIEALERRIGHLDKDRHQE